MRAYARIVGYAAVLTCWSFALHAHNPEARYVEAFAWPKEHFSKVLGLGYTELGIDTDQGRAEARTIGGKQCLVGAAIGLDVDDKYAFDIDERVDLTITYAPQSGAPPLAVLWDKNGGNGQGRQEVRPLGGSEFETVTVPLDRARFSGAGTLGIDVAVASSVAWRGEKIALCDVSIKRSNGTKRLPAPGRIHIEVHDAETGSVIPARVGVYDGTGRAPLPSGEALLVERFADRIRHLSLNNHSFWPSRNRVVFYTSGNYDAEVPSGTYEVVVSRGPEYRVHHSTVQVAAGETQNVVVKLPRYIDTRAKGWYSGDSHIHLGRDETRDMNVWTQVAAEDVHVGNLLQMGSIAQTYFLQPEWGKAGRFERGTTTIISGQEDPRTVQLGHTIHHNLTAPNHPSPETYFLYHRVFEDARRQGGVSGYAHLQPIFNVHRGLALENPFGLVKFIEVLQGGRLSSEIWYDFLNLGYKLTPAAGSDFPYEDLPGVVRNYVKLAGKPDADSWFKAFDAGHVYVTNGPFLEFSINGAQMGDELRVAADTQLDITAQVQLNPDVDRLDRLELVVQGEVVETKSAVGRDRIEFQTRLRADHSKWIAVRAWGARDDPSNQTIAHSTPIYVLVGDEPSWKREDVPRIVAKQLAALEEIRSAPIDIEGDLENFSTDKLLAAEWPKQRAMLVSRVDEAAKRYRALLARLNELQGP